MVAFARESRQGAEEGEMPNVKVFRIVGQSIARGAPTQFHDAKRECHCPSAGRQDF
jgi:hypothetical protein